MSRMLPRKRQTLDYTLWQKVSGEAALVSAEQAKYLADRDRGTSSSGSYFFQKGGRDRSSSDKTKVIDFVSLSSRFDNWFDRVRLDRDGLLEEIQNQASEIVGGQTYFEGIGEQWLEIEWGTLGRVIGAAVANIGSSEVRGWNIKGRDAKMSLGFWGDLDRDFPRLNDGLGIPQSKWEDLARFYRERKFDPNSEILRAFAHRPSSPFWQVGDDNGLTYYPNPLALKHRKRFQELYGSKDPQTEDVKRLGKAHGKLTLELINQAMVYLSRGNCAKFAIRIHGVCAIHVMRTVVTQQKIGLHLISNLAIRKETRRVGAQNVPDIAYHLDTGFRLAKVLEILQRSKLIDWYTIEKDVVDKALDTLL